MQTFDEALGAWNHDSLGAYLMFGRVEVRLEPLLFDRQHYLAVYVDGELVGAKVPVKPGYERG